MIFNFTAPAGTSQQAVDGFTAAGRRWSSLLSDAVTVNLDIGFSPLGGTILGQTNPSKFSQSYTKVRNALNTDKRSADDNAAYAALQTTTGVKLLINRTSENAGSATPYVDNNGNTNNLNLLISTANGRALGLFPANFPTSDGGIVFSSDYSWDFDPTDGVTPGTYDFIGIAAHEIGHALGFFSNVDALDMNSSGPTYSTEQGYSPSSADLFRFSTESRAQGSGTLDFCADARDKYFSIDGGTTKLVSYSTGITWGDGRQASHWKDNLAIGIMDPTAAAGETLVITSRDRQLLDVIGWNIMFVSTWTGATNANFSSGAQWSTSLVPGTTESVVFDLNNTYSINFIANANVGTTTIKNNGGVSFNLAGFSYATTSLQVGVNSAENVAVTFSNGSFSSSADIMLGRSDGASTASLTFSGVTAGSTTGITINPKTKLILSNTALSGGAITFSGGTLGGKGTSSIAGNVTGTGTINFDDGTLSVNGTWTTPASGTLLKTGSGTLAFAGTQAHGTNTTLNVWSGGVNFNTNAGSASASNLLINSSGKLNFNASQNLRGLNLTGGKATLTSAGGTRVLQTPSLSINGARLDLADNKLIVKGGTAGTWNGSAYTGVAGLIASGRGDAGAWDGSGIVTSMSDASPMNMVTTLAVATAQQVGKTTFGGVSVASADVLVMYTYAGDADFSGDIDGDDFFRIDTGYTSSLTGYLNGDFNYSGKIDADDYWLIDRNYSHQGSIFSAAAAVPEPQCLAGLALAAATLARRRRHR